MKLKLVLTVLALTMLLQTRTNAETVVGMGPETEMEYIGDYWCCAYCSCKKCCGKNANGITASGTVVKAGDCAVDPNKIPLGSRIYVKGVGFLNAVDTGSGVNGRIIDIYDEQGHQHALHYNDELAGKHKVWIVRKT